MTVLPTATGVVSGTVAFTIIAYAHWDILHSYEYPSDVSSTTLGRLTYSYRHRNLGGHNLFWLTTLPLVVGLLVYIFTVGLIEVTGL